MPVVFSLHVWGDLWADSHLQFYCANQAVVEAINRNTAKDPSMLALHRCLMLVSMHRDLIVHASHLLEKANVRADHLSWFQARAPFLQ